MSADPNTVTPPNPSVMFDMLFAFQRTAALRSAIELDVFRAVGEGPGDVGSIAKHCGASERGIRVLCDFLTVNGVLAKQNDRYKHTPMSAAFLDPRSSACMASVSRFLGNPEMQEPYQHLTEIVRNGRTSLPGEGSASPENLVWVEFANSMAPMMGVAADAMAGFVLQGKEGPIRVLDIAAGHGLFGIAVAKQNAQARITGLDWAAVLQVALRNATEAGVADRYELKPGSAFDVDYAGPYDIVLLTNFLHHFDHPTNVKLLKKVHASLKPGGRAAALEFVPNEDRVSPPMPATFAMTMLASTAAGNAYTRSELTAMYTEAGFKNVTAKPIPMHPETVVMAEV